MFYQTSLSVWESYLSTRFFENQTKLRLLNRDEQWPVKKNFIQNILLPDKFSDFDNWPLNQGFDCKFLQISSLNITRTKITLLNVSIKRALIIFN